MDERFGEPTDCSSPLHNALVINIKVRTIDPKRGGRILCRWDDHRRTGLYRMAAHPDSVQVHGIPGHEVQVQSEGDQGVQEGKKGERTHKNIIANGLVPVLVVVISFLTGEQNSMLAGVAFLSAISVAAADTTASELGVLSPRTYLITTLERVPPGTDGGSQHMEHYGASSPPFSLQRSAGSSCSRTIF